MSKIKFCPECFTENEMEKINAGLTHEIKGEEFTNQVEKFVCSNCGTENVEDDVYDESLEKAFNQYREEHNLLFPEEIKEIREMYDLSQRAFSRLLGWGEVTIHRYENGALQDNVHDELLTLVKFPINMGIILERNKDDLKPKTIEKVKKELPDENDYLVKSCITNLQKFDDEFTGNKMFDINKLANIVVFFTEKISNLTKSKLLKLLWYTEFLNFKRTSFSIAGTPFEHYRYGPIPPNSNKLLLALEENMEVIKSEEIYFHSFVGEAFEPNTEFDESLFSEEELNTLELVFEEFKDYNAEDICNLTHKEKGYKETKSKELISYEYAKDIEL
ncbi:MAG: type II TA system antitoxin MqsA family protein [Bacillota bacterium]